MRQVRLHSNGNQVVSSIRPPPLGVAKLYANVFHGLIPEKPDEIAFYVVPDITSPAARLLEKQNNWKAAAAKALGMQLKGTTPELLLEFATTWWPKWDRDNAIGLTDRAAISTDLRDEFFAVRKVIDASREEVRHDTLEAVEPLKEKLDQLLSHPAISGLSPKVGMDSSLHGLAFDIASLLGVYLPFTDSNKTGAQIAEPQQFHAQAFQAVTRLAEARLVRELGQALNVSGNVRHCQALFRIEFGKQRRQIDRGTAFHKTAP